MKIFTLADLHLSFKVDKPMEKFGDNWQDHDKKIENNWKEVVSAEDIVVIPGDISWAMLADDAVPDLAFIHSLPGRKIILKGNHDYWWQTAAKNRKLVEENGFSSIEFLYNSSIYIEEMNISLCGTRGWHCPGGTEEYSENDEKTYLREGERLKLSLAAAKPDSEIICFMHFPPFNQHYEKSIFTDIIEENNIRQCFYGHLHSYSIQSALNGKLPGGGDCEYRLVSADAVNFNPVLIRED